MFCAYGVQCIGYCSGFYTLSLPTYIFWLETFSNTSIAHMWCGNVLGLWGSMLKPPNLHFLVGNLQQYIYCPYVMWVGNLQQHLLPICDFGLMGFNAHWCGNVLGLWGSMLSLPTYIFWLEIFSNTSVAHMWCGNVLGLKPPNLHFLVGKAILQQYICIAHMWCGNVLGLWGSMLKPPNLHFLVGNLQQYIYCPYVMWQCFGLMGFNA